MKTINTILGIIEVFAILFAIAGAAFLGWSASTSKRMSLTDKAGYYYATEIQGESELSYMIGSFVDDVTDLLD